MAQDNNKSAFYEVFRLPKTCYDADVRKAFRAFSLRWHPRKNTGQWEISEAKFKAVCEAFEVLSDWRLRSSYDRYGLVGITQDGWKPSDAATVFKKFFDEHGGSETVVQYLSAPTTGTSCPPDFDEVIERLEQRQQFSSLLGGDTEPIDPWDRPTKQALRQFAREAQSNKERMLQQFRSTATETPSTPSNGGGYDLNLTALNESFKASLGKDAFTKDSIINQWKSGTGAQRGMTAEMERFNNGNSVDYELYDVVRSTSLRSRPTSAARHRDSESTPTPTHDRMTPFGSRNAETIRESSREVGYGGYGTAERDRERSSSAYAPTATANASSNYERERERERSSSNPYAPAGTGNNYNHGSSAAASNNNFSNTNMYFDDLNAKDSLMSSWRQTASTSSTPYSRQYPNGNINRSRVRELHEEFKASLATSNPKSGYGSERSASGSLGTTPSPTSYASYSTNEALD